MSEFSWDKPILSEREYEEIVRGVFKKIIGGQKMMVVVGLPGSGRSTVLRQMTYYPEVVSADFRKMMENRIWLVVDIPAEEPLEKTWVESPYTKEFRGASFEESVEMAIQKGGQLTWVVNSLDTLGMSDKTKSAWKRLITLYYRYPGKISFVVGQGCEEVQNRNEWLRELNGYYEQSLLFLKMREDGNKKNGGYWPLMARLKEKEVGIEDEIIDYSLEILWESCGEKSQGQLLDLMRGKNTGFSDYLAKTGVVRMEDGKWKPFSPLFYEWLKKTVGSKRPEIEERKGKLWLGESDLSEELSYQEYEVLKLLWQKRGEVVVRNEVAEVLWPKDTEDKYSDWAIDQVMAKIRRKIGDVGENRLIKTVKGRGVMLEK